MHLLCALLLMCFEPVASVGEAKLVPPHPLRPPPLLPLLPLLLLPLLPLRLANSKCCSLLCLVSSSQRRRREPVIIPITITPISSSTASSAASLPLASAHSSRPPIIFISLPVHCAPSTI